MAARSREWAGLFTEVKKYPTVEHLTVGAAGSGKIVGAGEGGGRPVSLGEAVEGPERSGVIPLLCLGGVGGAWSASGYPLAAVTVSGCSRDGHRPET